MIVIVIGLLMIYVFNLLVFWLNYLLLDGLNNLLGFNIVLLGLVIGVMMVIDMGGLFNKVVYVFVIGVLIEGNVVLIIVVMIGGMILLLVIVIVMLIFRCKFIKE